MAKVVGPLMSQIAHGTIGERLTFSKKKTGQQVRFQKAQIPDPLSFGQADVKSMYRIIYARWLSFSDGERQAYNDEAQAGNLKMSGWNLFLKYAMADPKTRLGLCGYWSMNRKAFETILDLSKNGNVGTLKPTYPGDCPAYVESQNTKMFNALSFDGANDYVDCGANISLNITSAITIGAWVKSSGSQEDGYGGIWYDQYSLAKNRILVASNGGLLAQYTIGGANKAPAAPANSVPQDVWTHVVLTYDGSEIVFWVNGIKQTPVSASGAIALSISSRLIGKGHSATYRFKGLIDEVQVYNRALAAPEILSLYNLFKT
jgi:hypothetical protein